ncbi:MAG TPA: hypothetical protein VFO39_15885 [Candidatus Sulfotelmatobacter sp.]|nr:hypothetical protein [Candidatus Sulfotelmatobacter sp.]
MSRNRALKVKVDERLESAIVELLALQEVLSDDEVDPRVLRDFRDALNRVRNTAWAAQQFVLSKLYDEGPSGLTSFLASERVRAAFQLCRSVHDDLQREEVQFKKGQLVELHGIIQQLAKDLKARL